MVQVAKKQPIDGRHSTKKNRIWFATKYPDLFSDDKVVDVTSTYLKEPKVKGIPYGAFIFSPIPLSHGKGLTLSRVMAVIGANIAAAGILIPTEALGNEWMLNIPDGDEKLLYLRAISLMVIHRIRHVLSQMEFVGSAQPLLALKTGEGTCFERAAILAAVFRLNSIPARVVGSTDLIPVLIPTMLPIQRHHWWIEAKIGEKWERFDPNLHPITMDLAMSHLPPQASIRTPFEAFLEFAEFCEFLRSAKVPVYVTDEARFQPSVESAIIAPEMELPNEYQTTSQDDL